MLHPLLPFALSQQFSFSPKQRVPALVCATFHRFSWLACRTLSVPVRDTYRCTPHLRSFEISKNAPFLHHSEDTEQGQVTSWSYFAIPEANSSPLCALPAEHGHALALSRGHIPLQQLPLGCSATLWGRGTAGRAHPVCAHPACSCRGPGKSSWKAQSHGDGGNPLVPHARSGESRQEFPGTALPEGPGKKRNLAWERRAQNAAAKKGQEA